TMHVRRRRAPKVWPGRIWIDAGPTVLGSIGPLKTNFSTRFRGRLSTPACSKLTSTTPDAEPPEPEPPPPPHPATSDAANRAQSDRDTSFAAETFDFVARTFMKRRTPWRRLLLAPQVGKPRSNGTLEAGSSS